VAHARQELRLGLVLAPRRLGGAGREFELAQGLRVLALGGDLFGQVDADTEHGQRFAVGAALEHAPCQHMSQVAVGMPVTQQSIGRPAASFRLFDGRQHHADVVRMQGCNQCVVAEFHLVRRQAEHLASLVAEQRAPLTEIVAPDGDASQIHGQRQLLGGAVVRTGRLVAQFGEALHLGAQGCDGVCRIAVAGGASQPCV